MKVAVNPPRTPVTKGSSGIAAATVPNVCKMPGPPAPFVPAPLPNIAQSSDLDKGTKKVKIEKKEVGIKGSTFKSSKGDEASKGTGGGLVSACTSGAAKFVAPGSMDVKAEGKNVHLLTDAMTNNNGGAPNAATAPGVLQAGASPAQIKDWLEKVAEHCNDKVNTDEKFTKAAPPKGKICRSLGTKKHKCCEDVIKDAKVWRTRCEPGSTPSRKPVQVGRQPPPRARRSGAHSGPRFRRLFLTWSSSITTPASVPLRG
jgi:hypothetical protein